MHTTLNQNDSLIASDRVEGTVVYNRQGDRLGTISRFMVGKVSGKAEYAVMSFGGLFGLGDSHYPIPWQTLAYDQDRGGYVVDLTKEQLDNAPRYDDQEPQYDDAYVGTVNSYYGLR